MKLPPRLLPALGSSLLLLAASAPFAAGQNLIQNGTFDSGTDGWTAAYTRIPAKIADEGTNHYLVLESSDPKVGISLTQVIKVQPGQWFEFTGRIRVKSVTPGPEVFHNARIQMTWKDTDNKDVKPWPPSPKHLAVTDDWVPFRHFLKAPPGAVTLQVVPAILGATGEAAYDDLELKTVNELDVPTADRNKYK